MIPEIDTQLAAVIKSLGDNVLPAVDAANPMASEQIRLCLATLGLVRLRLPDLHRYLRRDLKSTLALARKLTALAATPADPLVPAIAAGDETLADPEMGPVEIEIRVRALKEEIAAFMDRTRGTPAATAIAQAILDAEDAMILRRRAWAIPMGFEPDPSQIPALADLLHKE